jgi:hypothetical protein
MAQQLDRGETAARPRRHVQRRRRRKPVALADAAPNRRTVMPQLLLDRHDGDARVCQTVERITSYGARCERTDTTAPAPLLLRCRGVPVVYTRPPSLDVADARCCEPACVLLVVFSRAAR